MTLVLKKVEEYFKKEWDKAPSKVHENFKGHFEAVLKYTRQLAEKENADKEIVEISAWLHDISSIQGEYKDHHIKGAKIAEELLLNLNYPEEKINQVKHCILNHRGSQSREIKTKEAQILVDADAMAHFDEFKELFTAYKTKEEVLKKLERSYNKMSSEAKEIIKPKLEKVKEDLRKNY